MLKASGGNILKTKRRNSMKVKCFKDIRLKALEERINKFFGENNITLIDVKYSSCCVDEIYVNYSAIIIYREDN